MVIEPSAAERMQNRLEFLYGADAPAVWEPLARLLADYAGRLEPPPAEEGRLSQRDMVLITYGDQVRAEGESPLATLERFLVEEGLDRLIGTVHILPFYPYSSDDGFSVIDYRQVDSRLGDWDDVARLGEHVKLMFDLVLNHVSRGSEWVAAYARGEAPYDRYFHEVDPATDLSQVVRPRSLPLLSPIETSRGERHLWTTFSDDQIDLNFAEPAVLLEMLDVLLGYVERGARIVRLDAIAYLWKRQGTSCIHLPETHDVVKLMRDVLECVAPHVILLTETNVPHQENVSYFGQGDEAQMVYQFSLPPLLLDALLAGDASYLAAWLGDLGQTPPGCTFFNFTASHDGVGVRPLEGLVPPERLTQLVEAVRARGGRVNTRRQSDGTDSPYELNITYFDALGMPGEEDPLVHARRFLVSQAIMLSLRGVPGIYFHSLVASPNDYAGLEASGQNRRINRHKFELGELREQIGAAGSAQEAVYQGYRKLLALRAAQPAFDPLGAQRLVASGNPAVLAFERTSPDGRQHLLVVANVSGQAHALELGRLAGEGRKAIADLLAPGAEVKEPYLLEAYEVAWLELVAV